MDSDKVSYDILEWFPVLYCREVFSYLSLKDLLQASHVNKQWYEITAESHQFEKLTLHFDNRSEEFMTEENIGILRSSKRKYQNVWILLSLFWDIPSFPEFLEEKAGSWKKLSLSGGHSNRSAEWERREDNFEYRELYLKLIEIIEPSIEELSIGTLEYKELPDEVRSHWTFPHLKSLHFFRLPYNFYKFFGRCTTLEKLRWSPSGLEVANVTPDVKALLRNSRNLKSMIITWGGTDFLKQSSEFTFKLNHFEFEQHGGPELAEDLHAFLETQAESLETLTIKSRFNCDCFNVILSGMPRLHSLSTKFCMIEPAISSLQQPLPVNTTITSLELGYGSARNETTIETFLSALPNLKHLRLPEVDDHTLLVASRLVPNLESLQTPWYHVSNYPEGDIFPNIKSISAGYGDSPEPTGTGSFKALVTSQMREYRRRAAKPWILREYPPRLIESNAD